ncbi:MAG: lysophospholipid acyltransferase family protein [Armatimonadetes bacterium]|nr:lysophospholipid acyltransferase family protein [Armatimonadota bacterium]
MEMNYATHVRKRSLPDRIVRWIAGALALLLFRVIVRLSPNGLKKLARFLWRIAWPVSFSVKRKSRRNLELCLGSELGLREREQLLRRATYNWLYGGLLTWRLANMSAEEIRQLVDISGREHLDAALSKRRGVIAIGAHVGPFTLIGARLAVDGYSYGVVVRIASDPRIERVMASIRERLGVSCFYRGTQTLAMVRALQRGSIVHLFLDQHVSVNGVVVEFFGHPAPTYPGAAVLARRLNCPVLPIFLVPQPEGPAPYVVEIGPEYDLQWTDDAEADILHATELFSRSIEEVIRRFPDQWIWMHGRLIRPTDTPRLALPHLLDALPPAARAAIDRAAVLPIVGQLDDPPEAPDG